MIYCQKIKCVTEVQQFVACTLLNVQKSQSDVATWTQQALLFLQHHHFLLQYKHDDNTVACELGAQTQIHTRDPLQQSSVGGQLLAASPLGRATTLSGISPKDAVLVSMHERAVSSDDACSKRVNDYSWVGGEVEWMKLAQCVLFPPPSSSAPV